MLVEHFQSTLKIIIICQIVTTVIKKTKCTRKLGGHGVAMNIIVHFKKWSGIVFLRRWQLRKEMVETEVQAMPVIDLKKYPRHSK